MEFSMGSFAVKVEIRHIGGDPSRMSRRAKRHLAKQILVKLQACGVGMGKIDRIRVLRQMVIDSGQADKYNFGLKAAKDWVEEVFADNGTGEIAL